MASLTDFIKSSKQRILRVFICRKSLINCSLGEELIKFCQRHGPQILFCVQNFFRIKDRTLPYFLDDENQDQNHHRRQGQNQADFDEHCNTDCNIYKRSFPATKKSFIWLWLSFEFPWKCDRLSMDQSVGVFSFSTPLDFSIHERKFLYSDPWSW